MSDRRRWVVLAVGTFAQAATSCFSYGIPMLVPQLRADGVTLFTSTLLVSAPIAGVLSTLIVWGAAADRHGERIVIMTGVAGAAVFLAVAAAVPGLLAMGILLVLAGAAGASVNAASGRMVMGWFPRHERGLAMGTRQTSQPLGVALAALGLPPLAHAYGVHLALLLPAVLCALAAIATITSVRDPARPAPSATKEPHGSPYRVSFDLARVHLTSGLLVVPQFAVATFTLVYLVRQRHWDPAAAGQLIFAFQVAGAFGRIGSGVWSDRAGSRLRPMRRLAMASAVLMVVISLGAATELWFVVAGFALGAVITVADNGLGYTSVAELAGTEWSGRALGMQNTVQNAIAVATAPVLGAIIGESRYAVGFALVAIFPLLAIPLTPVRAETPAGAHTPPQRCRGEDAAVTIP